ncbi:MAG: DNA primase, partial [Bacteroidales bacterium]|nr:DNA primase [Bacteroidales bacterium]
MIKPETIQRIIETARIDEVVADFVSLKKRGANYIGLCPFHNEKTPSFHVSPSKGIFKCFGCSKGGDSVRFVMEHEHYSYVEALRFLAEKYHIEVEEVEMTSKMKEELSEKESLFAIHQFAQKYFADILFNHDEGKQIALPYFKERQFSLETIKKFQLGFCLSSWDAFTKNALENGYTHEQLVKSGIIIEKEGKYFDRFRERVLFPIHNISGRILGFGGRILTSDKSKAKYLNSPETDIYSKSKVLYGLHFSKNAIVKEDNCLLVEGYTDVLSMHQSGIENVVSSSGTALTVDQIRLIKKYTTNITIIYDGDPAGIKASLRGIGLVLAEDMNVKIVLLPEPEDPDSFVKKNRTAEVKRYFAENAQNFILFKSNLLLSEAKSDPIKKAAVISEIVEDISLIPNNISRSIYIKECSAIFDIPENSLIGQLNKLLARRLKKNIQR